MILGLLASIFVQVGAGDGYLLLGSHFFASPRARHRHNTKFPPTSLLRLGLMSTVAST